VSDENWAPRRTRTTLLYEILANCIEIKTGGRVTSKSKEGIREVQSLARALGEGSRRLR
jgi:hypothetical protein